MQLILHQDVRGKILFPKIQFLFCVKEKFFFITAERWNLVSRPWRYFERNQVTIQETTWPFTVHLTSHQEHALTAFFWYKNNWKWDKIYKITTVNQEHLRHVLTDHKQTIVQSDQMVVPFIGWRYLLLFDCMMSQNNQLAIVMKLISRSRVVRIAIVKRWLERPCPS